MAAGPLSKWPVLYGNNRESRIADGRRRMVSARRAFDDARSELRLKLAFKLQGSDESMIRTRAGSLSVAVCFRQPAPTLGMVVTEYDGGDGAG